MVGRFTAIGRTVYGPFARRQVIVHDRPPRGTVEVVILSGPQGPQESGQPKSAQKKRDRDQENQDVHDNLNRRALAVTTSDERDMARAANSGVTNPATANGTARPL